MSTSLQSIVLAHPKRYFLPFAGSIAFVTLNLTPSFSSLAILLTSLRLYAQLTVHRRGATRNTTYMLLTIAVGSAVGNIAPALHALSTPVVSIVMLIIISLSQCLLAMSIVTADAYISTRVYRTSWLRFTAFPTLWATYWTVISHFSPFGRLFSWTPVHGIHMYRWFIPIFGQIGIDWVTAAWAVALADVAGTWFMGSQDNIEEREEPTLVDASAGAVLSVAATTTHDKSTNSARKVASLGVFLALAAMPSFVITSSILPVSSTHTTPIALGCVLPSIIYDAPSDDALSTFITASQKLTSAKILLWPENALSFSSVEAKDAAFEKIRSSVPGPYIGVGFEISLPKKPDQRAGMKRNGFALVGPLGVVMEYYKQHLVPFTESFSYVSSDNDPPLFTLQLGKPASARIPKSKWAPAPSYTRSIPVTAAICLDFTFPSMFSSLKSRPALILAPAKTWDLSMGITMWEQARSRAAELGSTVLWCDAGGVSGVASAVSDSHFHQVGEGSWIKNVALEWPFEDKRTIYAWIGDWLMSACFILLTAAGQFGVFYVDSVRRLNNTGWYHSLRNLIASRKPSSEIESLID